MANRDLILELLDSIHPDSYCDDCLSIELAIEPRQQVNQLARRLKDDGKITRARGACSLCKKPKTINTILRSDRAPAVGKADASPDAEPGLNIERMRTQIVRICHAIWNQHSEETPPRSISALINQLKNEQLLPAHQANLMLTVCNLRNVYVYENVPMGPRELAIAQNALSIIQEGRTK